MRFNEFNKITEDTRPWVEKSALAKYQDPADISHQQKPAYQRKGVPEPITKPVPVTKPKVDYPAYKAQLDLKRAGVPLNQPPKDTMGAERPGNQAKPTNSLANDPVGRASAGEPTMGQKISTSTPAPVSATPPHSTYDAGYNAGQKVRAGIDAGVDSLKAGAAGASQIGKKTLGRVLPGAGVALDAVDAYDRYKKGDYLGAGIAGVGAAGGLVPGLGAPISLGAAGINMARDAYNSTPANPTNLNPVTSAANVAAANKGMAGRGGQTPAKPATAPVAPVASSTPPAAPQSRPAIPSQSQTTSGYKGSAGAQAIQQANADKIADVNKIRAGDTIKVGGQDYTIKQGDTLDQIAKNSQSGSDTQMAKSSASGNTPTTEESNTIHRIKSLAGLK